MKLYLTVVCLCLLPFLTTAQQLNKAKTFQKTVELAQQENKPILLVISFTLPKDKNSLPLNMTMYEADVLKKVNDNFIVFESNTQDTAMRSIISKYKINSFPTFLFMHPNKDVFYTETNFPPFKSKYLEMLDKAIIKNKEKPISILETEYLANKTDNKSIRTLIDVRKQSGLKDNAELIEQFANNLTLTDPIDYQTVLYMLEAGPYSDGNAYKLIYKNKKLMDSVYKYEPLQKRTAINNAIINNTMVNAARTKNLKRAMAGASFSRATWGEDVEKGNQNYSSQLIYYYGAIKDTTNYLKNVVVHYDRYYMNISVDSAKKIVIKPRKIMTNLKPGPISKAQLDSIVKVNASLGKITEQRTVRQVITTTVAFGNINYTNDLNNIVARVLATKTKNSFYLNKAMSWIKRAIEVDEVWGYYANLAELHYRLENYDEAITAQKKAIDLAKINQPNGVPKANETLEKMKNRILD